MKKFSIILLVACLLASMFAVFALADESVPQVIDLSEYDDDTIVALYEQVKAELVARKIEKTAHLKASPEEYVIGRDIPSGNYLLEKSDPSGEGYVSLKTPEVDPPKLIEIIDPEDSFMAYITAEDGDTLYLDFDCDLTISTGVKFE